MRLIYAFAFYLITPLVILRLAFRSIKEPAYRADLLQRFGHGSRLGDRALIWVHAVSAGETIAAVPLVQRLLAKGHGVVLTNMTPTGRQQAQRFLGDQVINVYAPYDLPGSIARFLNHYQPKALIVIDTELWPNILHACERRNIPACLVNGRLAASSFEGYRRFASMSRAMVTSLRLVAVQSRSHAERFIALGADPEKVKVLGSVKFDKHLPGDFQERLAGITSIFAGRRVILGASTHPGEEVALLRMFERLKTGNEDLLLVLVPRHVHRVDELIGQIGLDEAQVIRWSERDRYTSRCQIVVVDTMGELGYLYGSATVSFVGGSFVNVGGHNLMEAAMADSAIIMGPYLENIEEIASEFLDAGAMKIVGTEDEMYRAFYELLTDGQARAHQVAQASQILAKNQGALDRVEKELLEILV